MSKESIRGFFDEIGETVERAVSDSKTAHEESLRDEGREAQRQEDLIAVTELLLDLNTKDGRIYELLRKYFYVNSVDEISEFLLKAKIKKKRKDLSDLFDSREDYLKFLKGNNLNNLLRSNPKLLELPAEKLKKQIENK